MKSNKPLIRRTFLQERFDILMKKQRNGKLTFNDLTELDFIVNRDPAIRESILEEMQGMDSPPDEPKQPLELTSTDIIKRPNLAEQIKALLNKLFISPAPNLSTV